MIDKDDPSLVAMSATSIPGRYTDLEGPGTIRPGRRLEWWHVRTQHVMSRNAVAKWRRLAGARLRRYRAAQEAARRHLGLLYPQVVASVLGSEEWGQVVNTVVLRGLEDALRGLNGRRR